MKDRKNMVKTILIGLTISLFFCFSKTTFAKEGTVSTSNLRLRKEESTSSEVITLLDENDKVEVINENGDWYKIKFKDKEGYVNKQYIKVEANNDTTTNSETENNSTNNEQTQQNQLAENADNNESTEAIAETENKIPTIQIGTVVAESQIRIMPLINGDIIDTVKSGEKCEVISNVGLWSYVKSNEKSGWILKDKLTISEESISSIQENTTNNANIDQNKSEESKSEEDKKEENKKEKNKVEETTETKYSKSKKYYVNGTSVNARSEASKSSSVIKTLSKNAEITVTGEDGDWYVTELNGKKAYISKQFLSSKKVETTSRSSNSIVEEKKEVPTPVAQPEQVKEENNSNPPSNSSGEAIVSYAKQFLGYKYVYGTNGPNTFDCSGFVQYVYKHFGYSLSRSSKTQANDGVAVSKSNLQPGDILIFKNTSKTEIGHVGIYIGNDQFIHASNSRTGVIISSLSSASYQQRYVTARRVL